MSEEQNGITPTRPVAGYTPEPSKSSRDRDADGASIPTAQQPRKRRKRKKKQPTSPAATDDSSEEPKGGGKVDILAASIRFEMSERNDPAEFAVRSSLNLHRTAQGTQPHGTAIA